MGIKSKDIGTELKKFWLRMTDKPKYYQYKNELKEQQVLHRYHHDFKEEFEKIANLLQTKTEINCMHSGHLGDIIYAFPVLQEISKQAKCNLIIRLNHSFGSKTYHKHPSGNLMMTQRSFDMLQPLVAQQDYIQKYEVLTNQTIDLDLDVFRKLPVSMEFHSIRWYYHLTGKFPDMTLPFLTVQPHNTIRDKIVVVRTPRGRNPLINYRFLNQCKDVVFLGTKAEYDDFKADVPNADFYDVSDFYEMAQVIKASRLFISNQTFSWALAEGLKVNRLLEANPFLPVVFPIGGNGKDFFFQSHFEALVDEMAR